MQRLALLSIPLFLLSTPALSADLDGPYPPRLVERERTIERHYVPAPAYTEPRTYIEGTGNPRVHVLRQTIWLRGCRLAPAIFLPL
jgi:hypothetical protein